MSERKTADRVDHIEFDDNRLVAELSGQHDAHLTILEDALSVRIDPRGNRFAVSGRARARAIRALTALYEKLERGEPVGPGEALAAAKLSAAPAPKSVKAEAPSIKTPKRLISARSPNQAAYLENLNANDLTFGVGPAGTGKTYLAVAHAVGQLLSGAVDRIILSRPALEAGERIGFLPGDMKEKVDPFLRPLYDALNDMMHPDYIERRITAGDIEIAPIAFMRGRTLARAAVILDEAQNATPEQMKMFLTRLGEGAHMAVTGDPSQTDLPAGQTSGLADALSVLHGVEGVGETHFTAADVVRHPLVARIINAYDAAGAKKGGRD
ncbi:Phosphate starvation-inducible protein PhoH, predicted ATPase [hydrothermal vent metagenome]|uniref:PhoH-like protein n=1 Tax=hydrothermal vent metagenome TaxID=652676 RepID=A0A3B0RPX6_9ZZZZ